MLDRIARENMQKLYAYAYSILQNKHDAEDAAEDALYKLFCRKRYFKDENHVKAWLIRVTINNSIGMLNKRKRFADCGEEHLESMTVDFDYPNHSEIYDAVLALPVNYRTVILLFYYDDMSLKDISGILRIPVSTVSTRISRGRAILKEKLKGELI